MSFLKQKVTKKMITLNVFLKVKPTKINAFLDFLAEMTAKSRQESGNLYYNYFNNDDEFVIIEYWDNQASLDGHNESGHLYHFISQIDSFLSEPYSVKKYIPYKEAHAELELV